MLNIKKNYMKLGRYARIILFFRFASMIIINNNIYIFFYVGLQVKNCDRNINYQRKMNAIINSNITATYNHYQQQLRHNNNNNNNNINGKSTQTLF